MSAPLALKWGPTVYTAFAILLVLGLGYLIFGFGLARPGDIVVVSVGPLLFAALCLVCARRLTKRQANVIRPMKFVWGLSVGILAHGALALVLTGITYAGNASLSSVEIKNFTFALVEVPLGLALVIISARMRRSATYLAKNGVLK